MKRVTKKRPPTVGETLKEGFLEPLKITNQDLSEAMGVHRNTISKIVNDKQSLNVLMAAKLGKSLGTTAKFWLNIQYSVQTWEASSPEAEKELETVKCINN